MKIIAPPIKRLSENLSVPKIMETMLVITALNGIITATVDGLIFFIEFVLSIQQKTLEISAKQMIAGILLKEKYIGVIGAPSTLTAFKVKVEIKQTIVLTPI